jgi:peptide chain release factor 1
MILLDKLAALKARYDELTLFLSQPDAMADPAKWRSALKEQADSTETLEKYQAYLDTQRELEDVQELLHGGDADMAELAKEEEGPLKERLAGLEEELRLLMAPRDPNDDKNVIMELRAGTGGEEAALFAMDLLKMYLHYCERRGYKAEITDISETEIGGCKEATVMISGKGAYSRLKYESGAHRVQRVPETESGGRIHTSAATVAVLPEAEEVELEINPNELKVDTYRASGAGGQHVNRTDSAIRITHLPTGLVVTCQDERSQIKNREKAMRVLRSRLFDMLESEKNSKESQARKAMVGSGDRSERIRTYNFPQGRVTDHRIGVTLYKLDAFLSGDMDELLDQLTLAEREARMQQEA